MEEINSQDENQGMIIIPAIEVIRKLRIKQDRLKFRKRK